MRSGHVRRLSFVISFAILPALLGPPGESAQAAFPGSNGALLVVARARTDTCRTQPAADVVARISDEDACDLIGSDLALDLAGPAPHRLREIVPAASGASFSPGGSQIAYVRGERLATMRLSGADRRTVPGLAASDPAWAPDGRRLVATRSGSDRIVVVRRDGTQLRDLGEGWGARWSSRGRIAAMTSPGEGGVGSSVLLIDARTGARTTLAPDGAPIRRLFSVDWSPAGDRLVLSATVRGVSAPGVFVVDADGSGFRRLDAPGGWTGSFTTPAAIWSPDGRRIAFGNGNSIFTIRADPRRPVPKRLWRRVVRNAELLDWQALPHPPRFTG